MNSKLHEHYRRRKTCRLCGSEDLPEVVHLTPTPPANAFVSETQLGDEQEAFPLALHFCRGCTHLQLLDVVDPRTLFENYVYVSGTSPVFVKHFEDYAAALVEHCAPAPASLAIDIGSNDGTLLGFFKAAGLQVLGIDPARDIAAKATENGIETLPEFFTPALAERIKTERGAATIITANNVFAHADDLISVVEGIRELLAPDGVFSFEVSYLVDVIENTLFDTIYHEHLSYHAIGPLVRFFAANGMTLIEAERIDTHGGSIRGIAQLATAKRPVGSSVAEALSIEAELGLDREESYQAFSNQIDALKAELTELLAKLKSQGKSVAGFGAPAKATTLMYHFGLDPDSLDFIVDDSPLKQGLFTPGLHVPVLPSSEIQRRKPDYLLLLAWNFAEPIMRNNAAFVEGGGKFIIPVPNVEVCPA